MPSGPRPPPEVHYSLLYLELHVCTLPWTTLPYLPCTARTSLVPATLRHATSLRGGRCLCDLPDPTPNPIAAHLGGSFCCPVASFQPKLRYMYVPMFLALPCTRVRPCTWQSPPIGRAYMYWYCPVTLLHTAWLRLPSGRWLLLCCARAEGTRAAGCRIRRWARRVMTCHWLGASCVRHVLCSSLNTGVSM
jgi:hypothetical protein